MSNCASLYSTLQDQSNRPVVVNLYQHVCAKDAHFYSQALAAQGLGKALDQRLGYPGAGGVCNTGPPSFTRVALERKL